MLNSFTQALADCRQDLTFTKFINSNSISISLGSFNFVALSRLWLPTYQPEEEGVWVGYPACRHLSSVGIPEGEYPQVCIQPYFSPF